VALLRVLECVFRPFCCFLSSLLTPENRFQSNQLVHFCMVIQRICLPLETVGMQ